VPTETRPVARNIAWGIRIGLAFAGLLILWVIVTYLVSGREAFDKLDTTWAETVVSYLIAGLTCGIVLGFVRPHLTSMRRAVMLGPVIALPVFVTIASVIDQPVWHWSASLWILWTAVAAIFGSLLGAIYWFLFTELSG
jgi:hypothetical protein